jgi:hypothetical protein
MCYREHTMLSARAGCETIIRQRSCPPRLQHERAHGEPGAIRLFQKPLSRSPCKSVIPRETTQPSDPVLKTCVYGTRRASLTLSPELLDAPHRKIVYGLRWNENTPSDTHGRSGA